MTNKTAEKRRQTEDEIRDGFRFRSGRLSLDFAATLAGRLKAAPRELLATPADLARWLKASGCAMRAPSASDADLKAALALREAIYAMATERSGAQAAARRTINRVAAAGRPALQLDPACRITATGDARDFLALVAEDAIRLFGGAEADRVRQCEGDGCALLFVDLSRGGDRRWCSMQACGNRAKAAEFRKRAKRGGN